LLSFFYVLIISFCLSSLISLLLFFLFSAYILLLEGSCRFLWFYLLFWEGFFSLEVVYLGFGLVCVSLLKGYFGLIFFSALGSKFPSPAVFFNTVIL